MNNPLNDISEVYMESVSEAYSSLKDKEKDAMLNKARIHDLKNSTKAASLRGAVDVDEIRNKPRNTIFKKKKQMVGIDLGIDLRKESYSDWRGELKELVIGNPPPAAKDEDIATNASPKTDTQAQKEIKEKPVNTVNNKVKINPVMNPVMGESFENLGGQVIEFVDLTEERAKTREEARKKLEANRKAIEAGRPEDSPYGKHPRKKLKSPSEYGKDPWSTHAKAHAKEETELEERSLTDGEEDKKEKYVLSMKKNVDAFKKRYGDRAKSVMYATATKMAKEGYDMDMAADVFMECGYEVEEFLPILEDAMRGIRD